jgi:arginine-tRNA-protein transferase
MGAKYVCKRCGKEMFSLTDVVEDWDDIYCKACNPEPPAVTFLSTISPCEYLPDRVWRLRYELVPHLRPADYVQRLQQGWRRFGNQIFRPECPSCRMCQSLRVPVATFRPNPTQRRAWKRNQGAVTVRVGAPFLSRDRLDLWERFHRHGHETKGWPAETEGGPEIMLENPFRAEEWTYYVGNRLIAVAYVDALPQALSAIYCYYDPTEGARSLGTFNILSLLASARERGLAHVYLGYYVAGCRSLEYKRKFRPNEVLMPNGTWVAFNTS